MNTEKDDIKIIVHNKAPHWWDKEVSNNDGFLTSTTLWANFHEQSGYGVGRYFEVQFNKNRVVLVLAI